MAFNFLSVVIRFAKNQFEIISRCHYEDEVRSNPICVDCFTPFAMTIKNNFANLNLVKTFLTSITFDSLSEKIKNLRLVIKKFQTRRIFK